MGIHNIYLKKKHEDKMFKEVEERRANREYIDGRLIGKSIIVQEALADRYKKKRKS
jgi:hypothetical protein